MSPIRALTAGFRHAGGAWLEAVLIAILITMALLALSPVSQPAKELAGTGSALAAKVEAHISVPDAPFGSTTTATVNPGGAESWVFAECSQAGVVVYRQYVKADADNHAVLTLGPTPSWSSGSASCTAQEGYWFKGSRWRVLAETTFNAL